MKLRYAWLAAEMLGAFNLMGQYKKNTHDWIRIRTATVWLKAIGTARLLVIYQIGIIACVLVLVFSAILMEAALIFCISMSVESKVTTLLIVAALNFAAALGLIGYFLSSERWLEQAAKYNECVAELNQKGTLPNAGF